MGNGPALSAGSRGLLEAIEVWPAVADAAQPVAGVDITDAGFWQGGFDLVGGMIDRLESLDPQAVSADPRGR